MEEYKKIRGFKEVPQIQEETPIKEKQVESTTVNNQEYKNTANASYYDSGVCIGRTYGVDCRTANGEIFDETGLTFAHKSLSFGTRVKFQYNGNNVICRANDRGPYVVNREFDLSYGCAEALGIISKGVANISYGIIL